MVEFISLVILLVKVTFLLSLTPVVVGSGGRRRNQPPGNLRPPQQDDNSQNVQPVGNPQPGYFATSSENLNPYFFQTENFGQSQMFGQTSNFRPTFDRGQGEHGFVGSSSNNSNPNFGAPLDFSLSPDLAVTQVFRSPNREMYLPFHQPIYTDNQAIQSSRSDELIPFPQSLDSVPLDTQFPDFEDPVITFNEDLDPTFQNQPLPEHTDQFVGANVGYDFPIPFGSELQNIDYQKQSNYRSHDFSGTFNNPWNQNIDLTYGGNNPDYSNDPFLDEVDFILDEPYDSEKPTDLSFATQVPPENTIAGSSSVNMDKGKQPMVYSDYEMRPDYPVEYQEPSYGYDTSYYDQTQQPGLWQQDDGPPQNPEGSNFEAIDPTKLISIGQSNHDNQYKNDDSVKISRTDCKICLPELPTNHGVITNYVSVKTQRKEHVVTKIIYPNNLDCIVWTNKSQLAINCPGDGNHLINEPSKTSMTITCVKGMTKRYQGIHVKKLEMECNIIPKPEIKISKKRGMCVMKNAKLFDMRHYEAFLYVNDREYVVLYDLCSDPSDGRTYYTRNTISKELMGQEVFHMTTPEYESTGQLFFHEDIIKTLYDRDVQKASLTKQLFNSNEEYENLTNKGQYYLTPGRLVGRYDFVYRSEQLSAFKLGNTAPMWSNLEKNNWTIVEWAVSIFAAKRDNPTVVYTGTYDKQTINISGTSLELSLGTIVRLSQSGSFFTAPQVHYIPKIFFKILVDENAQKCIAIIAHNATYEMEKICLDVTEYVPWFLKLNLQKKVEYGIMYACGCWEVTEQGFHPDFLPSFPTELLNDEGFLV